AEDADVTPVDDVAQRADDALDARVVGRDAVAHETVRGRKLLEQVDRDVEAALVLEQDVGRVDAGGTGSHDRETELHAGGFLPVRRSAGCGMRSGAFIRRRRDRAPGRAQPERSTIA